LERYGRLSEFIAIEPLHNNVHQIGVAIMQACEQHDLITAKSLCANLLIAKDSLLAQLTQLQKKIILEAAVDPLIGLVNIIKLKS
jgi:hypothetical protein